MTLSSYSIGETAVTQELWVAVMGSNPSWFTGDLQRPVEMVTWNNCQTFITKLNQLTGENFRLPTEAEWEYAARGGNKSKGYKYPGSNTIDDVAWYSSNSNATTHPVATKAPNELGLYDMSGNVWEMCQDWCGSYSSDAQTNPTGPTSGSYHVLRGACWLSEAKYCRVSYRGSLNPYDFDGLRLAMDASSITPDTEAFVDLGLPSGTLWATCNVGANAPEEVGGYFAWGETSPKTHFATDNYEHYAGGSWKNIGSNIAGTQYDAATANWGSEWCMPTADQLSELASKCSRKSYTLNGVNGILFTGPNGNTIFIPNGGRDYEQGHGPYEPDNCGLWSSSACGSSTAYRAWEWSYISFSYRHQGFPIRPVRAKM